MKKIVSCILIGILSSSIVATEDTYPGLNIDTFNRLRNFSSKEGGVKYLKQELAKRTDISELEACSDAMIRIWNILSRASRTGRKSKAEIDRRLKQAKEIVDIILDHPKVSKETLCRSACAAADMVDAEAMSHIVHKVQRKALEMGAIEYVTQTSCPSSNLMFKLTDRLGNHPEEEPNVEVLTSWRRLPIDDDTLFGIDEALALYATGDERHAFYQEEFQKIREKLQGGRK